MPANNDWDIVIIGGGIHGVGVAQAAAAAGYRVVLLEQTELAFGTSSRSSKLIHGGLRYLEHVELNLVYESLRERELLLRIAPTLVKRQRFFIPVYNETSRRSWLLTAGLSLYAVLAGLRKMVRFRTIPKAQWGNLDGLTTDDLQTVFQYWDAQTDDTVLTQAVMDSAQSLGANLLCPASFISARIESDGCIVSYKEAGSEKQCRASVVVNAAGPWAKDVAAQFEPSLPSLSVENIQGTHLELPGTVEQGCYYLEVPEDKRAVFVMPHHGHTLLGSTEHSYTGDPSLVHPLPEEHEYLINVYRHYFPHRDTTVLNAWAGLRVLPVAKGVAFKRSRETHMPVDNRRQPRVLSIYGGKLTGYRSTAQKVLKKLKPSLPAPRPVADTRELTLTERA